MVVKLLHKLKLILVTFRFSILSIFITLFSVGVVSLLVFTYYRTASNITDVSTKLIKQTSAFIYHAVVDVELRSAEVTSKSIAQLIKQNILRVEDQTNTLEYFYNTLNSESLPIVQIIEWGDKDGNYFSQEREPKGGIFTNIIRRAGGNVAQTIIYRDSTGKVTQTVQTTTKWDPRVRPWFLAATTAKKFTWSKLFKFQHLSSPFYGTVAATPVYDEKGELRGVVGVGIRIDYLEKVLRNTPVSRNGFTFIATEDKKIIAISTVTHQHYVELEEISALNIPILTKTFAYYLQTKKSEFTLKDNNTYYLAVYLALPPVIAEHWFIGIIAPDSDFIGTLRTDNLIITFIGLMILLLGILIILKFADWIVKPIHRIVQDTEKIKNFNLEPSAPIQSRIKEVMVIANAINSMKKGLRSFQKYVPANLVRQLIEKGQDAKVGGEKRQLTVLFSDIKNFTTLAEQINPNELMIHLCEYFEALSNVIAKHEGTIDKYIGDSIMAFWGALEVQPLSCEQAAAAALECIERSNQLNERWKQAKRSILVTCIGLHCGEAIVGNLGANERMNYTAIGDTINMTSRLEGINRLYGTQIIVSDPVYQAIKNKFVLRMLDLVILKGKTEPTYIYELIAERNSELTFPIEKYQIVFAKAFSAYQQKKWEEASQFFKECLAIYANDTVAPIFIQRCEKFKINPPEIAWKGAWLLQDK